MKTVEEFYANTVEEGDCRIWLGSGKRIPQMNIGRDRVNVRKLVLQAAGRDVLPGRVMGCNCRSEKCIELSHIKQRTRREHAQYFGKIGAYSGPAKIGKMAATKRAKSKLDDEKVAAIRASDKSSMALSKEYGVAASYITSIKAGKLWKNYSSPFAGLGARQGAGA